MDIIKNIIKNQSVKQQIKINFFIVIILDIIFYIVMSFSGRYDFSTVLGILLGSGYSVLNFIFIAISMEKLILIPKNKLKNTAFLYYMIRYLLMAMFIFIVIKLNFIININIFLFFVTLFFSKLAIFIQVCFAKNN